MNQPAEAEETLPCRCCQAGQEPFNRGGGCGGVRDTPALTGWEMQAGLLPVNMRLYRAAEKLNTLEREWSRS